MALYEAHSSPPPRVSVIIPVLRWAKTLEDTLQKLTADPYAEKQVSVAIDEPSPASLALVQRYGRDICFKLSEHRRGKVKAIEDSFAASAGEILIFLYSDTVIRADSIISKTAAEIQGYDMLEMKKGVVTEGLLSNIVYYEYVGFNAANWMLARRMKKTVGVNGAGFAITKVAYEKIGGFRNVVSEDLDLGLRAYLQDLKFRYADDIIVDTFSPSTLKVWWKQRKRWSYGTALWFHDNYRPLLSALKKHPGILLTALVMIFPTLLSDIFGLAFKNMSALDIIALAMLTVSSRSFPLILAFIPYVALPNIFGVGLSILVGLIGYSAIYLGFTLRLGYKFKPHYFLLYYLVYSPVWLVAMIWGLVMVFVRKETISIDWKV